MMLKGRMRRTFHRLPGKNRLTICKKWIPAIRRPQKNLPAVPYLCFEHFESTCFNESTELKASLMGASRIKRGYAVPTIFAHRSAPKVRRCSVEWQQRQHHQEALQRILEEITGNKENTNVKEQPTTDQETEHSIKLQNVN
ncbi:THAP domain-containing protein 1 A-like isoform X2 [Neoarius graeffei]|uniref:THAP domain-containing protein 1 A-like isoform X2 n=1 Tax=Neoarius graeffei TaxID=443677 RepID=UPI00298C298E|nr:THAP domain-containing protein 1 A-like isoform X2 [Neoarius graeffei]